MFILVYSRKACYFHIACIIQLSYSQFFPPQQDEIQEQDQIQEQDKIQKLDEDQNSSLGTSLQGTIIFLNLPKESDDFIKNMKRRLYKRGAIISDFLTKRVTHIVTNDDMDTKPDKRKLIASKKYSRSMMLVKKSLKISEQRIRNSLSCVEQAKSFGIKFVNISDVSKPIIYWTNSKSTVNKHNYTYKWLENQSQK